VIVIYELQEQKSEKQVKRKIWRESKICKQLVRCIKCRAKCRAKCRVTFAELYSEQYQLLVKWHAGENHDNVNENIMLMEIALLFRQDKASSDDRR